MSWAEQNSATKLKRARGARKTAKAELRTAREKLKRTEKAFATLEAEKRRVREQRDQNQAELQRLDGQLRERRREEESIAAQVQRQNEQTDRIRGAEGQSDEQAQAESRLAALTTRLDEIREEIAGLETQERQARGRQTEIGARLQELDGKVEEKSKEKKSAKEEVGSKKDDLYQKVADVAEAVRAVKAEAFIDPLRYLKTWIGELHGLLQVFGAAGVFYAYTLMAGLVHEWWLYSSNGLRVTDYTILLDFLLILPVMSGVISTIAIILLGCGILLIPKISEYVALGLCVPLVALPVLRRFVIGLGMVGLSLIGPISVGYCKYNVEKTCTTCGVLRSIDSGSKNPVTVLTDPPLRNAEKLVLVGSNSTYMFFKSSSNAGDDSSGVKAVPLTRIVCVGQDCVAKAVESPNRTVPSDPEISESSGALPALFETVRGMVEALERIARWRNPDHAMTPFEKAVVDELGEIRKKIGTSPLGDPAGYSDYIAERLLPQFIREQMTCEEGREPTISDFIRFANDEPYPWCPGCSSDAASAIGSGDGNARKEALNKFYRKKIRPKVQKIVADFSEKSPTRWTVFGFASPDGEEGKNDTLSENRARLVIDEMCRLQENGTSEPAIDCGKKEEEGYADMQVRHFGEWHPINGISNSRSAVIAACVKKTNASSLETPTRSPPEVGSNNR